MNARPSELSTPVAPASEPVGEVAFEIFTEDQARLSAWRFIPSTPPRGALILQGGTAIPQRFYRRFARWLAGHGWAVYTFDYRGVGASRPPSLRGFDATMWQWGHQDTRAIIDHVITAHPERPRAVIGHSFGGQALGLTGRVKDLDAVVLIASQSGDIQHWPLADRLKFAVLWSTVAPTLTALYGRLPGWAGLGEDLPAGVARQWGRWCRTRGYITGAIPGHRLHYSDFGGPMLAWSFEDDDFAPTGSVEALLSWFDRADIDHRHHQPEPGRSIGHMGFFRPATGAHLWPEVGDWLTENMSRSSRPQRLRATGARSGSPRSG